MNYIIVNRKSKIVNGKNPEPPARTKKPFYAKQTQFTEYPNTRKLCINNGLCQYTPPQTLAKQSQFKANQSQFQPKYAENKPNQTQFFKILDF